MKFLTLILLLAVVFAQSESASIQFDADFSSEREWKKEDIEELNRTIINENTSHATFVQLYAHKTFVICDPEENDDDYVRESDKFIIMSQHANILTILERFGALIKKLVIKYSNAHSKGVEDVEEINVAINLYCFENLIHFEVDSQRSNFFWKMTEPFEKVEEVIIRGRYFNVRSETLDFKQLFPSVKRLTLKDINVVFKDELMKLNLPHLEHLNVHIERDAFRFTEVDYLRFLKNNRQIKSLTLFYASRSFLLKIKEILPSVESLELVDYDDLSVHEYPEDIFNAIGRFFGSVFEAAKSFVQGNQQENEQNNDIIFESLTNFTVHDVDNDIPENVIFTNLNEFYADVESGDAQAVIDFVKKHSNLKKFVVNKGRFNEIDFQLLTEANLDLEEVSLVLKNVNNELVISFVRNNENIRKIKIARKMSWLEVFEVNELGDEWIINASNTEISLERRN